MLKIGMSLGVINQREEMFRDCAKAGIECVEISCSYLNEAEQIDFEKVLGWSREYGVKLWSFHLPFGHFNQMDISSCDEELRKSSIEILSGYIAKAASIGIDKFILHPSGEPIEEADRAARMAAAKQSLKELVEISERAGGVLCVEDLPRTCLGRDSADIIDLISADSRLKVCFDTNHLLKEQNLDFISKLGDKIVTLHVSDYDRVNERHWLPGEGVNDWQAMYSALQKVGYNGPWLFEIPLQCPNTIHRDRDLACEDFARNARELFEGREFTVLSTKI